MSECNPLLESKRGHEQTASKYLQDRIKYLLEGDRAVVEEMDDVLFLQRLQYYWENSSSLRDPRNPTIPPWGESLTYDAAFYHIMLPELLKRLPRLIPGCELHHHFLCDFSRKDGCDERCTYDKEGEIPF